MPRLSPTHCFRAEEKAKKQTRNAWLKIAQKIAETSGVGRGRLDPVELELVDWGSACFRDEAALPSIFPHHHIIAAPPSVSSQWRENGPIMSSPQQQQLPPERSIFGVDPLDDFATMVGDWIYANSQGRSNVEVSMSDRCSRAITAGIPDSRRHRLPPPSYRHHRSRAKSVKS